MTSRRNLCVRINICVCCEVCALEVGVLMVYVCVSYVMCVELVVSVLSLCPVPQSSAAVAVAVAMGCDAM
jgi:hypothetical protein